MKKVLKIVLICLGSLVVGLSIAATIYINGNMNYGKASARGHDFHWEKPKELIKIMLDFKKEVIGE